MKLKYTLWVLMNTVFQLLPQENLQYSQKHIQQIQQIINSIEEMSSHFEQKTATDTLTGTFMLYRKDGQVAVEIRYDNGNQSPKINVRNNEMIVTQQNNKKTHDISKSHLYKILSGQLDLAKTNPTIIKDAKDEIEIKIDKKFLLDSEIILSFEKYKGTNNVWRIIGWKVSDGKNIVDVRFKKDTIKIKIKQ